MVEQAATVAAALSGCKRAGFVVKKGHRVKSWRPRFLVLTAGNELVYFKGRPPADLVEKGRIPLCGARLVEAAAFDHGALAREKPGAFVLLTARGVAYPMLVEDLAERAAWVRDLRHAIRVLGESPHKQQQQQQRIGAAGSGAAPRSRR